ncbi:hypothetical protein SDC9_187235 [bioreactor metagenome]|uniref:Uncharacterized protein n=1 Tax=bioreactor metagenome TaxID=1076179 RepID=A0A645HMC6_9ZZZZ
MMVKNPHIIKKQHTDIATPIIYSKNEFSVPVDKIAKHMIQEQPIIHTITLFASRYLPFSIIPLASIISRPKNAYGERL